MGPLSENLRERVVSAVCQEGMGDVPIIVENGGAALLALSR